MFAGLMSGLTLGLMSLSLVDLEVLSKAGTPKDKQNAGTPPHLPLPLRLVSGLTRGGGGAVAAASDYQLTSVMSCVLTRPLSRAQPGSSPS